MRYDQVVGLHIAVLYRQTFTNLTPGNHYGILHSQREVQDLLGKELRFVGQWGSSEDSGTHCLVLSKFANEVCSASFALV
jgi:hypothetical protein